MSYASNLNAYQTTMVNSASPLQLVIMLYDGALKFMTAAKQAMANDNLFEQNLNIQRAQKILTELMSCLDMNRGGEVASNLFALYTFAFNELTNANIEDDPSAVDRAAKVLKELRGSWSELDRKNRAGDRENSDGSKTKPAAA